VGTAEGRFSVALDGSSVPYADTAIRVPLDGRRHTLLIVERSEGETSL